MSLGLVMVEMMLSRVEKGMTIMSEIITLVTEMEEMIL